MAIQIVGNQIKNAAISTDKVAANAITPAKAALNQLWSFATIPQISADPTAANELVRKSYVDSKVNGLSWKASCKVKAQGNVDLSGPGASIDSQAMSVDDRFLCTAQTTASQNGIYLWKGAAAAAVRADDADAFAELQDGTACFITAGTDENKGFQQVAVINSFSGQSWILFSSTSGGRSAGTALDLSGNTFNVKFNNSSIGVSGSDQLEIKAGGITSGLIAAGTIANDRLANSQVTLTAGSGLTGFASAVSLGGSSTVAVQADGGSLTVSASGVKVSDGGVGQNQLAANAVRTAKIQDGDVTLAKLQNLNSGQILLGDGSSRPAPVTMSGHVQISNTGATTIQSNAVATAMVNDGAISNQKLASSSLTLSPGDGLAGAGAISLGGSANLNLVLDGSTLVKSGSGLKVGSAAITATELATACVATDELADGSVTTVKLANDCVDASKIADNAITMPMQNFAWRRVVLTGSSNTAYDLSHAIDDVNGVMVFRNGLLCKKVSSSPADSSEYTISATGGTGGVGRVDFGAAPDGDSVQFMYQS